LEVLPDGHYVEKGGGEAGILPPLAASYRKFFCEAEPVTFAATAVLTDAMFPTFLDRDGGV